MIVLDTDVLIAFFRKEDQNYQRAVELIKSIDEEAVITIITLSEFLTFIKKRDGGLKAKEKWENLKDADIKVLDINEFIEDIIYLIEKYQGLSFGDASSIVIMKRFSIGRIYSFDSDFDLVQGIQRIY